MDGSIDFQPYLSSICHDYAEWWKFYTLTDIEGKIKGSSDQNERFTPFDFELMMQAVNQREPEASRQERTEKLERRPVLDGLRKSLTEAKHILLIGRPGSGKSTTLARLLLEEAQQNQGDVGEKRIPVLVELRSYKTSVLDLMQDFFRRHDLTLKIHQIETLLSQNCLLLLVDGLNELPSETARQDIVKLRNYRHVPMIFTTRDLSLGGDFGIEKRWEMLPLTEPQMKEFIQAHLSPEQADTMWRQLQDRTRKFAETPLLLWMLCELFGQVEEIPRNLGEVFHTFTRAYEDSSIRKHEVAALKGDVQPLSDRRLWFPALKHLAYLMMQGATPVDSRPVISREEAEEELQAFFSEEPYPSKTARDCLDDLLKYHLLQIRSGNEIEFRHQLFQEYYAAEWLLQRLPSLTDEQLKYYFLNYLKWTEAIALMLGLTGAVEEQVVHTLNLAFEVDFVMSAEIAGKVREQFKKEIVRVITELQVSQLFKVYLLGKTCSKFATPELLKSFKEPYPTNICKYIFLALKNIEDGLNMVSTIELTDLDKPDLDYYIMVINLHKKLSRKSEKTVNDKILLATLDKVIESLQNKSFRFYESVAAFSYESVAASSVEEVLDLFTLVEHRNPDIRMSAADRLGEKGLPEDIHRLSQLQVEKTIDLQYLRAISSIQKRYGFYNYEIAKSDPPPPISFEKLSANSSPTYNFYGSVGNVANTVHGNQISHQSSLLNPEQLSTNCSDSTILAKAILEVIFNTGISLERSSREVRSLPEESLREFFVSGINAKYPDSATGETRNKNGKTDILVRVSEKNILIAECKFWSGEEKLKDTLDQLLDRYTTVRDTQIAMLIFSRNKDFTNVKQSIPQAMKQHPSFEREISIDLEKAWYEYVVFHPDDRACELTLTVLAFHLSP